MRLIIKEKNKVRINRFIDWLFYMVGYTLVFIIVTSLFKSIVLDPTYPITWSIVVVLLLYLFNKTIKPILVTLTIPITGITLGLFYPCINLFIFKLTDWLLDSHFDMNNIFVAFFAAILITVINFILDDMFKKMVSKVKNHE